MKGGALAAALILVVISAQGCIFDPREPESPDTDDQDTWIVPNAAKDVFINLSTGWTSAKNSNYERSLDPEFRFQPRLEDEMSLGSAVFADWTKDVELQWLTRVKEVYPAARTIQFGDENGVFEYEDPSQVGLAIFEGQYRITADSGDGDVETYAGIARFIVINGSQGWVLAEWTDLDVNGNYATSGYLRGTLRAI